MKKGMTVDLQSSQKHLLDENKLEPDEDFSVIQSVKSDDSPSMKSKKDRSTKGTVTSNNHLKLSTKLININPMASSRHENTDDSDKISA